MFQFNKSIDVGFMESMYENDYVYIQQLFEITLTNYDNDAIVVSEKYKTDDLEGVRKAIHKMKSAFGFTGMINLQNNCQLVETKCSSAASVNDIKKDIEILLQDIHDHKIILQNEYQRLKIFNSQAS